MIKSLFIDPSSWHNIVGVPGTAKNILHFYFILEMYIMSPVPVFTHDKHGPHRCSHDNEDVSVRLMELFIIVELLPQLPKDLWAREWNVGHFL